MFPENVTAVVSRVYTLDNRGHGADGYMIAYNQARPHQGRGMTGRTPIQIFLEGITETKELPRQGTDDIMAA